MQIVYNSSSSNNTKKIGLLLAKILQSGDIILFSGELGAGKTVLISGIAGGLGLKENLTSPSFIILNIYSLRNKKKLIHADFYRLDNIPEIINTGIEDYIYNKDCYIFIEWGNRIKDYLKEKYLEISIDYILTGKDDRRLQFESRSRYWDKKLKSFEGLLKKCIF